MPKTQTPLNSGFELIGQTLSDATGKMSREKYMHLLDELFADAAQDPEVTMLLILRKGKGQAALLGVKDGESMKNNLDFVSFLRPIYFSFPGTAM
jgi:hypothetical protein